MMLVKTNFKGDIKMQKYYLSKEITAVGDARLQNETVKRLVRGFTMKMSKISFSEGKENTLSFGKAEFPVLKEDAEYAYRVTGEGVALVGHDYPTLMRGLFDLLQQIEWTPNDARLFIRETAKEGVFKMKNRMIHFCAFPETPLLYLKRAIRLAAALQYTHAVIEFWGTFPYECLPELAWENAYKKEDIRRLSAEMRELGIEAIPMCNSLGHATQCRGCSGKHVVLDQNPMLYRYFTPDGWSWNIENPETRALLKKMRAELYDVFGDCRYFHLGLDESVMYAKRGQLDREVFPYVASLTEEIRDEGKRPMIWMDMFLPKEAYQNVGEQDCTKLNRERFLEFLSTIAKETVLVDWQYFVKEAPVSTTEYLKDCGFSVLGAPWLDRENGLAHIETVEKNRLFGVMLTTWHILSAELPKILSFARNFGAAKSPWSSVSDLHAETATMLRKLSFEKPSYEECGWVDKQTHIGPCTYYYL